MYSNYKINEEDPKTETDIVFSGDVPYLEVKVVLTNAVENRVNGISETEDGNDDEELLVLYVNA